MRALRKVWRVSGAALLSVLVLPLSAPKGRSRLTLKKFYG